MRKLLGVVALALCLSSGPGARAAQPPLLEMIPDGALLAGAMRGSGLELMRGYFVQSPELQRDLSALLTRRLGIDLTRIDGVAAWSTHVGTQPTVGAFVRVPQSTSTQLKGTPRGSFDGVELIAVDKLVAAAVPGGMFVGDESEVRAGIAVAHHRAPPLSGSSPLGSLLGMNSAELLAGMAVAAVPSPDMQLAAQQYGVQLLKLSFDGTGRVVLEADGDGAKLKPLAAIIDGGAKIMMMQLKLQHDRAMSDDTMGMAEAVSAVAGFDGLEQLWKEAAPRLEGDRLVSRYQMPQVKSTAALTVPVVGVLAAVAIPAFMKYIRRSKTVEATMNVRKLADAAASYAESAARKQKGRFTFPRSTAWTPAGSCCPQAGGKCQPDPKLWRDPTFETLNFSVDNPFYYQYRVTSEGRGAKARVTVEARGDLDCDQVTSSFKRTVTVDAQGNATVGPLESANDIE